MVIMILYNPVPVREIYISVCLCACALVCLCNLLKNYIANCFYVSFKENILEKIKQVQVTNWGIRCPPK